VIALRELIRRSATAALAAQASDGSLAAGRNGPYGDPETPLRNTGHWLVTFLAVHRWTGDPRFGEAAQAAARFAAGDKARPSGGAFWHRTGPGKDACNGLVGQAWTIEALSEAATALQAPELAETAERVFLLHPFDAGHGLWRRIDLAGRPLGWDDTFNHQLWFAAAGALLAPHAGPEVAARVVGFLDRLSSNLALRPCGLVRQAISPLALGRSEPRTGLRQLRARWLGHRRLRAVEVGYHAFNLYALALLRRHVPDHAFWGSRPFARLWAFARSPEYRDAVAGNAWGWPYNPTGFEMAYALDVFEGPGSRAEQRGWVTEQLRRHWDLDTDRLGRCAADGTTLAARLYEATRLPALELEPADWMPSAWRRGASRRPEPPLSNRQERPQVRVASDR
jgi:hypothetical protein